MSEHKIDVMWDDTPVDVSTEVNFIWSIANKLRGTYQSDKYKDVIIPMVIIRRFECALDSTKQAVVNKYKENPAYPAKAMYRVSGFQFFNTSEYTLAELVNDPDHLAANFRNYIEGFSANVQDIIKSLDFDKQIDKMDKNNRLLSVVKAFSELDLDPKTIDNVKMGYIFEDLIRRFSENAEAGDHYTGRDIIKLMVNILLAEGCDDISMTTRRSPYWTRQQARAVCSRLHITSFIAITRLRRCVCSGRRSTLSPMLCAWLKCLSRGRMPRISVCRTL